MGKKDVTYFVVFQRSKLWLWFFVIAIFPFTLYSLDFINSMERTLIAVDLEVNSINFTLKADYEANVAIPILGPSLTLSVADQSNRITPNEPNSNKAWYLKETLFFHFDDDSIVGRQGRFKAAHNSRLLFERHKNRLLITVTEGAASASFDMAKDFLLNERLGAEIRYTGVFERASTSDRVRSQWAATNTGSMNLHPDWSSFHIPNIYIKHMNFSTESDTVAGFFECFVQTGNIRLLDYEKRYDIIQGDCPTLNHADGVLSMTSGNESLRIRFVGRVKELALGPPGYQREITPSLLQWLLNQPIFKLSFSLIGTIAIAVIINVLTRERK